MTSSRLTIAVFGAAMFSASFASAEAVVVNTAIAESEVLAAQ